MVGNLFVIAVNKNEENKFFMGKNGYYSHNPMDGEHCYGVMLSGAVNKFIDMSDENVKIFNSCFKDFIESLNPNSNNLKHLLVNLSEIQRLRQKGLLKGVDFDDSSNADISKAIECFFPFLVHDKEQDELIKFYLHLIDMSDSNVAAGILKKYLR